uniref:Uncharacterized protein n=1 Tax=Phytophthora fragariae TaxID=53985 RepID=A0A6A3FJX8_9STRA|nr:hypothetical protein PF009_g8138 [Phytophthora fragariae]
MYRAHEPLGGHGKATTDGPEYDGGGLVLFHNEQFLGWLSEDLTPLLLVRRDGVVFWRVETFIKYANILHWFRDSGCKGFSSIAALARVWLGRSPSNAFQERVFRTGSFVVSYLRIHNDSERA